MFWLKFNARLMAPTLLQLVTVTGMEKAWSAQMDTEPVEVTMVGMGGM